MTDTYSHFTGILHKTEAANTSRPYREGGKLLSNVFLIHTFTVEYIPKYGDRELRELWPRLLRKIPAMFTGLVVEPALLHGDLWSGNVAENEEGAGKPLNSHFMSPVFD